MRNLFVVVLSLAGVSPVAYADWGNRPAECAHLNADHELQGMDIVSSKSIRMRRKHVAAWEAYFDYELTPHCAAIMDSTRHKTRDGKVFYEFTTNDDECDGGNVYGLFFDQDLNVVVEVSDGDLYCPRNPN